MTPQAGSHLKRQTAPGARRWSWPITIGGSLAIFAILIVGVWGYDCWANSVPSCLPMPPPMPRPNGFERALALLARLPPESSPQGTFVRWPDASPDALQQAVRPAAPNLRRITETFRLTWLRPPHPPFDIPLDLPRFRGCARFFEAQSLLAEKQRDATGALTSQLDAMELGAKMCRGGELIPFLSGVAIHAIGFAGTERVVSRLPAGGIPSALVRVRRIRQEWPRYPEVLEAERECALKGFIQAVRAYEHPTPLQTLEFVVNRAKSMGSMSAGEQEEAFVLWLTPKQAALRRMDGYFQAMIGEYRKPLRSRRTVSIPTATIFRNLLMTSQNIDAAEALWWRTQVDLDLLEVALAVRLYRLETGRYPIRLSDIPRGWLPAIPVDPWGQPIAYRLRDGSPVIYSIGPDGRDDSGRPANARELSRTTQGDLIWGALARRPAWPGGKRAERGGLIRRRAMRRNRMCWTFERVASGMGFVEGPAWDGSGLLFTDIPNSRIMRYDAQSGQTTVFREGTNEANGLMFDPDGRLYGCEGGGRRIVRYEPDGRVTVIADRFEGRRLNSPNDLAIDARGRIWFTDPRYGEMRDDMELDHESVFRLDPQPGGSWSIRRMTFDTTRPNGLLISPDQKTLYVAQSEYGDDRKRELRAYPILNDDTLGPSEVLHNFYPHRGIDGMCLDVEGNIVATAGWELSGPGPMIYVFAPNGRVLETHPLPGHRPTNCTFGGPRLSTLYVTVGGDGVFRTETNRTGRLWYPKR